MYFAVIILVKYFGKLIYESDERNNQRKEKTCILFYTLNLLRLQYIHDWIV